MISSISLTHCSNVGFHSDLLGVKQSTFKISIALWLLHLMKIGNFAACGIDSYGFITCMALDLFGPKVLKMCKALLLCLC